MKQNLFLLALFFIVLHFCKAGPLRLHKRAAFYIANETACVVDNIVYSNGDPIPTDDPCEACKCRPPGFACVLKECRVKPGCRAVRHVGQCCPEYVCGCEHNGRMYQDGEEIRDDKNPCYTCHCQGSSIACAFVDCFFRIDCVPEYLPGECCPRYDNCTRDLPESNPFNENNNVPSLNLLPVLNDESIFPAILPTPQEPNLPEIVTDPPTQPPVVFDDREQTTAPEVTESTPESSEPQTTESENSVNEESKPDSVIEEKNADEESAPAENINDELIKDENEDKKVEESEVNVLFNSGTDIKNDENVENAETTTVKNVETTERNNEAVEDDPQAEEAIVGDKLDKVTKELATILGERDFKYAPKEIKTENNHEAVKDDPQTTVVNPEEPVNEAEVTENSSEAESASTEIPSKVVKNSAADNSKSLKLSDDEDSPQPPNVSAKEEESKAEEHQNLESTTDKIAEQSSTEPSRPESVDPTESKPESEIIPEESQNNPQNVLYSNDDKIKSESVETVTIVVNVNEKPKLTTETDFVAEEVSSESVPTTTAENLIKYNSELNTEVGDKSSEGESTSSSSNFEVFATSTESSPNEVTSSSSIEENSNEGAEGRSEVAEVSTSDPSENSVSTEADLKNEEVSSEATTAQSELGITERLPAEARTDEDANESAKTDQPGVTIIKIEEPNVAINIKITTNPDTVTPENKETTENESKSVETTDGSVEESKPEVREDDSKPLEEQNATEEKVESTTAEVSVEVTSPRAEERSQEQAAETESTVNENTNDESTTQENSQENESAVTTESRDQVSEESVQTEAPNTEDAE